ncbi:hypothetical protein [Aeromicrobium sp. P5_D10]
MKALGMHIEGAIDVQTDLLDRQIVSSDGAMIAKVDDIEVAEHDSRLIVSGLLVGPGALGPRLGGVLGELVVDSWSRLARRSPQEPRRIDYTHVSGLATVLTLDRSRRQIEIDGLETWTRVHLIDALPGAGHDPQSSSDDRTPDSMATGPDDTGDRHRFSRLAGMRVILRDGTAHDLVTDVRLAQGPVRGHLPTLTVDGMIVGRNRPGTLFGYDRNCQQGPWLIQQILRWVHRHAGYVDWSEIASIDWEARTVTLAIDRPRSLRGL